MFPAGRGFLRRQGDGNRVRRLVGVAWPLWLLTALLFDSSSLAALVASAALVAAPLVTLRHHDNIRRLIACTESPISFGKGRSSACLRSRTARTFGPAAPRPSKGIGPKCGCGAAEQLARLSVSSAHRLLRYVPTESDR
jgi:hypothetical protein